MSVYWQGDGVTVHHGECIAEMAAMPEASVDAIVTDPPYGLGFMGKKWDNLPPGKEWARECLRVLKPGGHLLAFGGTRTWHRLAVAVEDAGFEIRDSIAWLYGSGFPKSTDVSKAVDKLDAADERRTRNLSFTAWMRSTGITAARINELTGTNMGGHYLTDAAQPAVATADLFDLLRPELPEAPEFVEALVAERTVESRNFKARAVIGERTTGISTGRGTVAYIGDSENRDITAPATADAAKWQGWGTALKPAHEPIIVARKPLQGTVAANVLRHGTGALNIDGCRIEGAPWTFSHSDKTSRSAGVMGNTSGARQGVAESHPAGRWPANVVLDETHEPVLRLRYNLPVDVERTIREFFDASTDHLPRLRDSNAGAAEPSATDTVLLPEVLRRVDEPEPDGRERDSLAAGPHPGIPKEDAGFSGGEGTARTGESSVDGRDLPQPWIRPRSRAGIEPDRTGDLLLDAQRLDGSGLHTRAPSSRSEILGATLGVDGACSPHKRGEGRQPSGELGTPLERGSSEDARRGGARGLPATSGERHSPGIPLEILRREVPPLWLTHFEDTGRTVRGGQAAALDAQSGISKSLRSVRVKPGGVIGNGATHGKFVASVENVGGFNDQGGASRFFYCAKAPKNERPVVDGVAHPTVKPLSLMRWLVRLVTPPGGTVLDPFAGSGTTIEAAILEGFDVIGIEREADYLPLIQARLDRTKRDGPDQGVLDFGSAS